MGETAWLDPPPHLRTTYSDLAWSLAYQYAKRSVVYRLSRGGVSELFVKLSRGGHYPTLSAEAERIDGGISRPPHGA